MAKKITEATKAALATNAAKVLNDPTSSTSAKAGAQQVVRTWLRERTN